MADDQPEALSRRERTDESDELRTVAFRMREIQRLLGVRVEQENRRLEAEGLDPVRRPRFHESDPEASEPGAE